MRDINGKRVALWGRRPPHFSTGVYRLEQIDSLITDADPKRSALLPRFQKAGVSVLHAGVE